MQFQSIFSSLLISLTLVSTSMASLDSRGQHINHNAHARAHSSHAKMLQSRELYHSNSIPRARDVNGSRKMVRKATQEQLDYQEKFNKMNSEVSLDGMMRLWPDRVHRTKAVWCGPALTFLRQDRSPPYTFSLFYSFTLFSGKPQLKNL